MATDTIDVRKNYRTNNSTTSTTITPTTISVLFRTIGFFFGVVATINVMQSFGAVTLTFLETDGFAFLADLVFLVAIF